MKNSSPPISKSPSKLLILATSIMLVFLMAPTEGFSSPAIFSRRVTPYSSPQTRGVVPSLSASLNRHPRRRRRLGPRATLRGITGFSWTAFRATFRAATGVSLTAVYATTLAASGQWMRQTMRCLLSVFPAWARYFVQPLLVCYYAPLFILRSRTKRQRKRDVVVEGWKEAVERADDKSEAYWSIDE